MEFAPNSKRMLTLRLTKKGSGTNHQSSTQGPRPATCRFLHSAFGSSVCWSEAHWTLSPRAVTSCGRLQPPCRRGTTPGRSVPRRARASVTGLGVGGTILTMTGPQPEHQNSPFLLFCLIEVIRNHPKKKAACIGAWYFGRGGKHQGVVCRG